MFKYVLPRSLELLVFRRAHVNLWTEDPVVAVEKVRTVSVCIHLRVVSCIHECKERVDI